jgi:hypothetical protein
MSIEKAAVAVQEELNQFPAGTPRSDRAGPGQELLTRSRLLKWDTITSNDYLSPSDSPRAGRDYW